MTAGPDHSREHLLLYEPRTEGHHLCWLRFLTEDLLSANYQLSLAVDLRPAAQGNLKDHLSGLLSQVRLYSVHDAAGRRHGDGKAGSVAFCLRESGAERVFLAAFDEIASSCWRRAACGLTPPAELRGRMGGIYHRPRFFVAPRWSPNRLLKRAGFRRLLTRGWLRQLLFVDEYLACALQREFPGAPFFFLPDPCSADFRAESAAARLQLGLPQDKRVLLFFGTGQRRKGLHLVVEALLPLSSEEAPFLLCAGQQDPQGSAARGLDQLVRQGRARVINRYVSTAEEKLSFAAADAVLLPYVNHFGTSGVLAQAMAAGKMAIVSDEQLLGRLTREHGLGLLFPSGDVAQLRERIRQATAMSAAELARWSAAAKDYAQQHSRDAYRRALLASLT
ncbi:MAG: glycosyltransferase family 4 protein [Limisphaerales bacterium]